MASARAGKANAETARHFLRVKASAEISHQSARAIAGPMGATSFDRQTLPATDSEETSPQSAKATAGPRDVETATVSQILRARVIASAKAGGTPNPITATRSRHPLVPASSNIRCLHRGECTDSTGNSAPAPANTRVSASNARLPITATRNRPPLVQISGIRFLRHEECKENAHILPPGKTGPVQTLPRTSKNGSIRISTLPQHRHSPQVRRMTVASKGVVIIGPATSRLLALCHTT